MFQLSFHLKFCLSELVVFNDYVLAPKFLNPVATFDMRDGCLHYKLPMEDKRIFVI